MIKVNLQNNPKPGVLTTRKLLDSHFVGMSHNKHTRKKNTDKILIDIALVSAKHSPRKMVQLLLDKHGARQLIDALNWGLEAIEKP